MTGWWAFLRKEVLEIARTWRLWVLPGLIGFFAVTSPVVAALTPALVAAVAGSRPGVVIQIPPPVAADAYRQFLKNLDQLVTIAIILAGAGAVSGERRAGTAALVLTKPLSRGAFVVAKMLSHQALLAAATAVGALLCIAMTSLIFGASPIVSFLVAVLLWLVHALVVVALVTLFSTAFRSPGAAAGMGLGAYLVLVLLRAWPPAAASTFAGLPVAASTWLAGGTTAVGWPLATALVASAAGAALGVRVIQRQEL